MIKHEHERDGDLGLLASLLGARTLLGAPGLTTRNKKLLETVQMDVDLVKFTVFRGVARDHNQILFLCSMCCSIAMMEEGTYLGIIQCGAWMVWHMEKEQESDVQSFPYTQSVRGVNCYRKTCFEPGGRTVTPSPCISY